VWGRVTALQTNRWMIEWSRVIGREMASGSGVKCITGVLGIHNEI
jgi:hypothetical protein